MSHLVFCDVTIGILLIVMSQLVLCDVTIDAVTVCGGKFGCLWCPFPKIVNCRIK